MNSLIINYSMPKHVICCLSKKNKVFLNKILTNIQKASNLNANFIGYKIEYKGFLINDMYYIKNS